MLPVKARRAGADVRATQLLAFLVKIATRNALANSRQHLAHAISLRVAFGGVSAAVSAQERC